MNNTFPISRSKSPAVILELMHKLKVKDIMTTRVFTASPTDTFRSLQLTMKKEKISGIPIVSGQKLLGLISLDDLLNALDKGYVESSVEPYMTQNVVTLDQDMPLSLAISYFNHYPYRRYPVINKDKDLAGMLTSRDILTALVHELDREIGLLENKLPQETVENSSLFMARPIKQFDFETAGSASSELKKVLQERNIHQKIIRKASIASYELEINIVIHSTGGQISFSIENNQLEITALDFGPGIPDIEKACQEGFSTANEWIRSMGFGAGMGLPNVKKYSDSFHIESQVGVGTKVISIIQLDKNGGLE